MKKNGIFGCQKLGYNLVYLCRSRYAWISKTEIVYVFCAYLCGARFAVFKYFSYYRTLASKPEHFLIISHIITYIPRSAFAFSQKIFSSVDLPRSNDLIISTSPFTSLHGESDAKRILSSPCLASIFLNAFSPMKRSIYAVSKYTSSPHSTSSTSSHSSFAP